MDYFEQLSQNYIGFRDSTTRISDEDRSDPALSALAQVVFNSLQNYRGDLATRPDFSQFNSSIKRQKKAEYLQKARAKFNKGVGTFFDRIEKDAGIKAQNLKSVSGVRQPESAAEIALQGEVRSRLRSMSVSDRIAALQNQSNAGDFRIFEAIENDPLPIPGFLGNPDESGGVLDEARSHFIRLRHGETWHQAQVASHNLEIAGMVKAIAVSSSLRQIEVNAGL
jgi:hypothetical protein